jgi:two-component system sensor histidine kinase UhpB
VASTVCRACIVRDDTGRATRLIGALQDITVLQALEKKLEDQVIIQKAQGEKFLLAAKLSFDVIWDWDLVTNEVFIGEGFEELFGYVIKENKGNMITDWANYMHPGDKKEIKKELYDSIKSTATEWQHAYRVTRADGSIAKVYARASIIRDKNGKAYRMIGAMQDLSRQKELEEELGHEIKLKEKQISEATEDAKEMERSNIGKELHDNINQLLGASRMYLEMAKRGGVNSPMYLSRSSEYTLTAIEEIRKLSKGLTTDTIKNLGLCIAIDNLAIDMSEVNAVNISCSLEGFNEKTVTDKFKLNIFRIVQEHLNNILKHAKATQVAINLSQNKTAVELDITDNGVGFDTEKKQTGIGVDNIKSRAKSYNGEANFISQPGSGCSLTVTFPVAA